MQAMRVALMFNRPDVDAFIDELTHDEFAEWCAFIELEPQGWQATRIQTRRLSWVTAQHGNPKRLREGDFDLDFGRNLTSASGERARFEAAAIRSQIAAAQGRGDRGR